MSPLITNLPSKRGTFHDLFAIDIRSLAVLRIGLGLAMLYLLIEMLPLTQIFLSDSGVLPLEQSKEILRPSQSAYWSLYWFDGSTSFCRTLIGIHILAAIGFLLGFQTRWMTVVCLLLTWSLEVRNPLLQDWGQFLIRMMLIWSLFLPLGSVWSVDAWYRSVQGKTRKHKTNSTIANAGTVALMVQVVIGALMFSLVLLLGRLSLADWYLMEVRVLPRGEWIAARPNLQIWLGRFLVLASFAAAITMFVPRLQEFFRGIWVAIFMLIHVGIWITLSVGIYPLIGILSLVVFVPGSVWDSIVGEPIQQRNQKKRRRTRSKWEKSVNSFCYALLAFVVVSNLVHWKIISFGETVNRRVDQFSQLTMTQPQWNLQQQIAELDETATANPVFEYQANLENGTSIDLMRGVSVSLRRSKKQRSYPTEHWRRFHLGLWHLRSRENVSRHISTLVLQQLLRNWNSKQFGDRALVSGANVFCKTNRDNTSQADPVENMESWGSILITPKQASEMDPSPIKRRVTPSIPAG